MSDTITAIDAAEQHGALVPSAAASLRTWLRDEPYVEFRAEIEQLVADQAWDTLNSNFYQHIEFGTGGIRGTTGVGPNRINNRTIGEAAQGLINYLKEKFAQKELYVVIGYDTRLTSKDFAEHVAAICAANGLKVGLFDGFRSTPELSFAVRDQQADAGIVISASHNPPSDNGFKVYNESGGQVIPEEGDAIIAKVKEVVDYQRIPFADALASGQVTYLPAEVDARYVDAVLGESVGNYRSATVVYSPIHGAGQTSVLPVLQKAGFDIQLVENQMEPDGHFPNVANHIPNPEELSANDEAKALLVASGRDIALTNDPDADRLAALVKTPSGPVFLNGNQIASLVTYYVFSTLEELGKLPKNGFLARTIVTTPLLDEVARKYNLKIYNDLLVGFKYIGELIRQKQDLGDETFLLGGEESFGMLKGSYVRDKDGAVAALMLVELASKLKEQGKTLVDALDDAYRAYGYYSEHLSAIFFEGMTGAERKNTLMASLRDNPPTELAGIPVTKSSHQVQDSAGSFIVKYEFGGDHEVELFVRPSGTEPKVKFYVLLREGRAQGHEGDLGQIKQEADALAKRIDAAIQQLAKERAND